MIIRKILWLICFASSVLWVNIGFAQQSKNIEIVNQLGGNALDVEVIGNYAYMAYSSGLYIVNIKDKTKPMFVSKYLGKGEVEKLDVSGSYVYLAEGEYGLRIIDVKDPTKPKEVACYDTPGNVCGVYVLGNYAYVVDGKDGLRIIDVEDPSKPREIGYRDTPHLAKGVYVINKYAYVADEDSGLRIIDVREPAKPKEVGYCNTPGKAIDVFVSGNYAYIANSEQGLRIIDIKNPVKPKEVGHYGVYPGITSFWEKMWEIFPPIVNIFSQLQVYDYAYAVYVSGKYAYLANNGLHIIDISKPNKPKKVKWHKTLGGASNLYLSDGYIYLADDQEGLRIIEVKNPKKLKEVGCYNTLSNINKIYISGKYAYSGGGNGFRIIDISKPNRLKEVGSWNTPYSNILGIYISGNYAYIADYQKKLRVIDIKDITKPKEVGRCKIRSEAWDVCVRGKYAYVADNSGLQIIEISNPTKPKKRGYYKTLHHQQVLNVCLHGNYAYLATGDAGLQIIDISNPNKPQKVEYYDTQGEAHGLYLSGNYLYVGGSGKNGLRIMDISNSINPKEVGWVSIPYDEQGFPNQVSEVCVSNNYAYLGTFGKGLWIIDVKDPTKPKKLEYDKTIDASGIYVVNNYVYLAGWEGLYVFRCL